MKRNNAEIRASYDSVSLVIAQWSVFGRIYSWEFSHEVISTANTIYIIVCTQTCSVYMCVCSKQNYHRQKYYIMLVTEHEKHDYQWAWFVTKYVYRTIFIFTKPSQHQLGCVVHVSERVILSSSPVLNRSLGIKVVTLRKLQYIFHDLSFYE